MKAGWEIKTLGEVCDFQNGFAFKANLFRETGYPILRISNIQDEEIETRKIVYFNPSDYKENLDKYRVVKDDLMIAMSGATTGKIGFNKTEESFYLNQRVGKFEPAECLSKRYLFYFLSTRVEENLRISAGAAQPNLSTEQIKSFNIPLPSLPEQKRLVTLLDEAFESIATAKANAQQNLKNARALFESHLNEVFTKRGEGWEEKKLADICEVKDGTHDSPKYIENGIPFVTQKNVREDGLSFENTKFICQEDHDKFYKRSNVTHGDILISMIGANRGMACIVDDDRIFSIKNVGLIKQNANINKNFLLHFLKSSQAANYVRSESRGGAQEFIGLTELRKFIIPVAPLNEQNFIAAKLTELSEETQRLEALYSRKIAALDELKKALLHRAFSGAL